MDHSAFIVFGMIGLLFFATNFLGDLVSLLLVLAGAIAGTYLGLIYGQYTDATYLGRRYTIVNAIHYGAPIGGIIVSTSLGLFNEIRTKSL